MISFYLSRYLLMFAILGVCITVDIHWDVRILEQMLAGLGAMYLSRGILDKPKGGSSK